MLVCTAASGRPVKPCLDPWPEVYDFQVSPDRSLDPPDEPLPARWNLDDIWGSVAAAKTAPDDASRLQSYMMPPLNTYTTGGAGFDSYRNSLNTSQNKATLVTINPANYDGTFVPSASVRTVTPPNDEALPPVWTPPWAAVKGI